MVMAVLVAGLTCAFARLGHAAGVEIFTPAAEIGSNYGYFVCLVFNVSARELHGTAEFINATDPFVGNTLVAWTLPPKGVFYHIRQWLSDIEVFHAQACHVVSSDAMKGDLLVSHCGANSGLQCQQSVQAQ
jgi:hypothetical protein